MKKLVATLAFLLVATTAFGQEEGFVSLWDGKTFDGWKKATENPTSFRIEDGAIIANGPRCHLFYVGDVGGAKFKNFELKVDVMTSPSANGGIYFHTAYQESNWPAQGFEVQVNNSHGDWRRTGSLYEIQNVKEGVADNVWFTEHIIVRDKHVAIYVDGQQVVDWTQPEGFVPPEGMSGRLIQDGGTVGFQAHDPGSRTAYKNIRIKILD
jgi:hypothetical protein